MNTMSHSDQVEQLIKMVAGMDKPALLRQLQQFPAPFPLDFTPDFLDHQPVDRLRHLFLAVCLQSKRLPELPADESVAAA